MKSQASDFVYFSIALDESTDNSDTAQLAIMVRGVDQHFNVTEDLLTLGSLHGTQNGLIRLLLKSQVWGLLPTDRD